MARKVFGWICPVTGTKFAPHDTRLSGYGLPPSSPLCQSMYKGTGRYPMERKLFAADELPVQELERCIARKEIIDTEETQDA